MCIDLQLHLAAGIWKELFTFVVFIFQLCQMGTPLRAGRVKLEQGDASKSDP